MTLTNIEKAAKLMGLGITDGIAPIPTPDGQWREFNPYNSKSDLSDVIDELGIDVIWCNGSVLATTTPNLEIYPQGRQYFKDHPNKFTARAHAVMAVVEQIYDAKFGKDGE